MRVLLIDNYDSFTWNLVHLIGGLGAEVDVWRNDALTVDEALAGDHDAIVLSPGPCTPNEAGICLNLIREGAGKKPIFGVCLGLQAMGQAFGGQVVWVPWSRPGFQLGLEIAAIKEANPQAIGCILGGHGITAWGDTSKKAEANSVWIIRTAEE